MQAYTVLVSEDDNADIRDCDVSAKHVIVTAQTPAPKGEESKIAVGVAPCNRTDALVAVPQNSLWFDDLGTAASYLKGMVEDINLAKTLNLKPLTTASGVLFINVFSEPRIHDGMLDVQMHAYPQHYVTLKELIPALSKVADTTASSGITPIESAKKAVTA